MLALITDNMGLLESAGKVSRQEAQAHYAAIWVLLAVAFAAAAWRLHVRRS